MSDWQLERAWVLYRFRRRQHGSDGHFDDVLWTACVKQARGGAVMRCKAPCSDEVFVVAWEKATSLKEAARLAGYEGPNADQVTDARAARLRGRGVKLRRFRNRPAAAKLNWLAARARKEA